MMDLGLNDTRTSRSTDLAAVLNTIFARPDFVVTGIGSRETPDDVLALMTRIGTACEARGGKLRSGGAGGADLAFEAGWRDAANCEIFHPWRGFKPKIGGSSLDLDRILGRKRPTSGPGAPIILSGPLFETAKEMASHYHPAWHHCSDGAKALHARNMPQVLGPKLDRPTDVVICWTVDGGPTGGTGQALRVAMDRGITIVNLQRPDHRAALIAALGL